MKEDVDGFDEFDLERPGLVEQFEMEREVHLSVSQALTVNTLPCAVVL